MPEFYMTLEIPEFFMIFAGKINKIHEFCMIFAGKKCPNFT